MKEEKEIKKSSAKKGTTKTSGNAKKQSSNKNTAIKKEAPTKSTTSKTKKTPSKTSADTTVTKKNTSVKKNTNKKTASNSINKTKVAAKTSKPTNNDKKEVIEVKANIKDEIKNEEVKKEEVNITKENQETTTSKIKGYELFIIAGSLALLIALVLMVNSNNTKAHCKKAICNESGTICYTYRLDKEGNTKKTWEGRCPKN